MKQEDHADTTAGAQTVDRACELLREIARTGPRGIRILDLCNTTGLSRPTTHRILRSLQAAGLVQQYTENRRYALGSGMFELGMAARNGPRIQKNLRLTRTPQHQRLPLQRVQGLTDGCFVQGAEYSREPSSMLMLRSYDDVLCAWRAQGAFPIKPNVVPLGERRPLAASMAGLGILGALPEDESDALIAANSSYLPAFCKMSVSDVKRHVQDARQKGYSTGVNAVIEGITAVGMAVPSSYQRPYMALSVSAISSRIPPERIATLVSQLKHAAAKIAAVTGSNQAAR